MSQGHPTEEMDVQSNERIQELKAEIASLKDQLMNRLTENTFLRIDMEAMSIEHLEFQAKIESLEKDREAYGGWSHSSATSVLNAERRYLEGIICRLREEERNLREMVGNTRFLKDQLANMTNSDSTKNEDGSIEELKGAQHKIVTLETMVHKWLAAAKPYGIENPSVLSIVLASTLGDNPNAHVTAAQEATKEAATRIMELNKTIETIKKQRDQALSELKKTVFLLKYYELVVDDFKRRIALHDKDRLRTNAVLDAYQTELAAALSNRGVDAEALASRRLVETEKVLRNFRDLMLIYRESDKIDIAEDLVVLENKYRAHRVRLQSELNAMVVERDDLRKQLDVVKGERDFLQKELQELTTAQLSKGNAGGLSLILQKKIQEDLEKALDEVRMLKTELRDAGACSSHKHEVQQLQEQIKTHITKIDRLRRDVLDVGEDFKTVCSALTGYKIIKCGSRSYRVESVYAQSPDEFLTFTMDDEQTATMVETDYSGTLKDLVDAHLNHHYQRSVPMFLASLTLQLFAKRTVQQVH